MERVVTTYSTPPTSVDSMTPAQNENRVTENASLSVIDMRHRDGTELLV
jgi:hypothetical protein